MLTAAWVEAIAASVTAATVITGLISWLWKQREAVSELFPA
jgi:hypothetical protein